MPSQWLGPTEDHRRSTEGLTLSGHFLPSPSAVLLALPSPGPQGPGHARQSSPPTLGTCHTTPLARFDALEECHEVRVLLPWPRCWSARDPAGSPFSAGRVPLHACPLLQSRRELRRPTLLPVVQAGLLRPQALDEAVPSSTPSWLPGHRTSPQAGAWRLAQAAVPLRGPPRAGSPPGPKTPQACMCGLSLRLYESQVKSGHL